MSKRARRWPVQMVPNLVAEGNRILKEIAGDGHRGSAEAACGGSADGAGAGAGAGREAGGTSEAERAATGAAYGSGQGTGIGPGFLGLVATGRLMTAARIASGAQPSIYILSPPPPLGEQPPTPKIEDAGITVGELVGWRWWVVQERGLFSVVLDEWWPPKGVVSAQIKMVPGHPEWDGRRKRWHPRFQGAGRGAGGE